MLFLRKLVVRRRKRPLSGYLRLWPMLTHFLKLFFVLILGGTLGYHFIEKAGLFDSLYMTVITIGTVGYTEVVELDANGRVFTMILILGSFFVLAYGASVLAAFIIEQELEQHDRIQANRMKDRIARLKDQIIICGVGRTGSHVLDEIVQTRRPCVVVDTSEEVIRQRLENYDFPYIVGKAHSEQTLKDAGVERAMGVAGCLPSDADNLFLAVLAKGMNPNIKTVCKVETRDSMDAFTKAGVDYVVDPGQIGGMRMASALVRPNVVNFLDVMLQDPDLRLRIEEVSVPPESPAVGKTLGQMQIGSAIGTLVLAIRRGGKYLYNPSGTTSLAAGDMIIVLGTPDQRTRLAHLLTTGNAG